MEAVLLAQVFACFFMTGLIWTIQLLHYPSFGYVHPADFETFHAFHSRRITWIVLPMMTTELATAAYLVYVHRDPLFILNFCGVVAIWTATALLSVPAHERLGRGFDPAIARRLILTNWARTILWTARSLGLLFWLCGTL